MTDKGNDDPSPKPRIEDGDPLGQNAMRQRDTERAFLAREAQTYWRWAHSFVPTDRERKIQ